MGRTASIQLAPSHGRRVPPWNETMLHPYAMIGPGVR